MEGFEILYAILIALFGAVIGAWVQSHFGIFQDRQMRKEERGELRRDILRTLLNEIKHNHEILERGFQERTRYFFLAFWSNLRTNAFVSVVSSEQYILISSKAQNMMSEYYGLVQRLNELALELEGEEKALTIQTISGQQTKIFNSLVPLSKELVAFLEEQLST